MTYTLGLLPGDPTQERVLIDVTCNPAGWGAQVMYCLDVVTVPNEGVSIVCDGQAWFLDAYRRNYPGEHPDVSYRGPVSTDAERREAAKAAKAAGTYRPTLRELLWQEEVDRRCRKRKSEWMRNKRARQGQERQPIACHQCGATFIPKRSTAHFCSTRCRVAAHRARCPAQ